MPVLKSYTNPSSELDSMKMRTAAFSMGMIGYQTDGNWLLFDADS